MNSPKIPTLALVLSVLAIGIIICGVLVAERLPVAQGPQKISQDFGIIKTYPEGEIEISSLSQDTIRISYKAFTNSSILLTENARYDQQYEIANESVQAGTVLNINLYTGSECSDMMTVIVVTIKTQDTMEREVIPFISACKSFPLSLPHV